MLGAVAPRAPAVSGKGRIVAFMMSILAEMRRFIRQASLETRGSVRHGARLEWPNIRRLGEGVFAIATSAFESSYGLKEQRSRGLRNADLRSELHS